MTSALWDGLALTVAWRMAAFAPEAVARTDASPPAWFPTHVRRDCCETTTNDVLWWWSHSRQHVCRTHVTPNDGELQTLFCHGPVLRRNPTHHIVGVLAHHPSHARKKCCLPPGVHALICFKHDGFRDAPGAFSTMASLPCTRHSTQNVPELLLLDRLLLLKNHLSDHL